MAASSNPSVALNRQRPLTSLPSDSEAEVREPTPAAIIVKEEIREEYRLNGDEVDVWLFHELGLPPKNSPVNAMLLDERRGRASSVSLDIDSVQSTTTSRVKSFSHIRLPGDIGQPSPKFVVPHVVGRLSNSVDDDLVQLALYAHRDVGDLLSEEQAPSSQWATVLEEMISLVVEGRRVQLCDWAPAHERGQPAWFLCLVCTRDFDSVDCLDEHLLSEHNTSPTDSEFGSILALETNRGLVTQPLLGLATLQYEVTARPASLSLGTYQSPLSHHPPPEAAPQQSSAQHQHHHKHQQQQPSPQLHGLRIGSGAPEANVFNSATVSLPLGFRSSFPPPPPPPAAGYFVPSFRNVQTHSFFRNLPFAPLGMSPSTLGRPDLAASTSIASSCASLTTAASSVTASSSSQVGPVASQSATLAAAAAAADERFKANGSIAGLVATSSPAFPAVMHTSRNANKNIKCPHCNWHYKYTETLANHIKDKHPAEYHAAANAASGGHASGENGPGGGAGGGLGEAGPQCHHCLHNSPHPRLSRGESYPCGYKPYRCDVCDYSTTTKGNLAIHKQSDKHLNNVARERSRGATSTGVIAGVAGVPMTIDVERGLLVPLEMKTVRRVMEASSPPGTSVKIAHPPPPPHPAQPPPLQPKPTPVGASSALVLASMTQGPTFDPRGGSPWDLALTNGHCLDSINLSHHRKRPSPPADSTGVKETPAGDIGVGFLETDMESSTSLADGPLFQCAVCENFSSDSLDRMAEHMEVAQQITAAVEVDTVAQTGEKCWTCRICPYQSALKANFQLHCKTDKHLQRQRFLAHLSLGFEGAGGATAHAYVRMEALVAAGCGTVSPVLIRCRLCGVVINSIDKMRVHVGQPGHEAALQALSYIEAQENERMRSRQSSEGAANSRLMYACLVCSWTTTSKLGLLRHVASSDHTHAWTVMQPQWRLSTTPMYQVIDASETTVVSSDSDDEESGVDGDEPPSKTKRTDKELVHRIHCPLCGEMKKEGSMEKHLIKVHSTNPSCLDKVIRLVSGQSLEGEAGTSASVDQTPKSTEEKPQSPVKKSNLSGNVAEDGNKMDGIDNIKLTRDPKDEDAEVLLLPDEPMVDDSSCRCHFCGNTFKSVTTLFRHMTELCHTDRPDPSGRFLCWKVGCNQYFSRLEALRQHFGEIHVKKLPAEVATALACGLFPHACPYCPLAFRTGDAYRRHAAAHVRALDDGRRGPYCVLCSDAISTNLRTHLEEQHLSIKCDALDTGRSATDKLKTDHDFASNGADQKEHTLLNTNSNDSKSGDLRSDAKNSESNQGVNGDHKSSTTSTAQTSSGSGLSYMDMSQHMRQSSYPVMFPPIPPPLGLPSAAAFMPAPASPSLGLYWPYMMTNHMLPPGYGPSSTPLWADYPTSGLACEPGLGHHAPQLVSSTHMDYPFRPTASAMMARVVGKDGSLLGLDPGRAEMMVCAPGVPMDEHQLGHPQQLPTHVGHHQQHQPPQPAAPTAAEELYGERIRYLRDPDSYTRLLEQFGAAEILMRCEDLQLEAETAMRDDQEATDDESEEETRGDLDVDPETGMAARRDTPGGLLAPGRPFTCNLCPRSTRRRYRSLFALKFHREMHHSDFLSTNDVAGVAAWLREEGRRCGATVVACSEAPAAETEEDGDAVRPTTESRPPPLVPSKPVLTQETCNNDTGLEPEPGHRRNGLTTRRHRHRLNDEQRHILRASLAAPGGPLSEDGVSELARRARLPTKVVRHWLRSAAAKERSGEEENCQFGSHISPAMMRSPSVSSADSCGESVDLESSPDVDHGWSSMNCPAAAASLSAAMCDGNMSKYPYIYRHYLSYMFSHMQQQQQLEHQQQYHHHNHQHNHQHNHTHSLQPGQQYPSQVPQQPPQAPPPMKQAKQQAHIPSHQEEQSQQQPQQQPVALYPQENAHLQQLQFHPPPAPASLPPHLVDSSLCSISSCASSASSSSSSLLSQTTNLSSATPVSRQLTLEARDEADGVTKPSSSAPPPISGPSASTSVPDSGPDAVGQQPSTVNSPPPDTQCADSGRDAMEEVPNVKPVVSPSLDVEQGETPTPATPEVSVKSEPMLSLVNSLANIDSVAKMGINLTLTSSAAATVASTLTSTMITAPTSAVVHPSMGVNVSTAPCIEPNNTVANTVTAPGLQQYHRRVRTTINNSQLSYLLSCYEKDSNPSKRQQEAIATRTGLPRRVVQVWFQNTRARDRKGTLRGLAGAGVPGGTSAVSSASPVVAAAAAAVAKLRQQSSQGVVEEMPTQHCGRCTATFRSPAAYELHVLRCRPQLTAKPSPPPPVLSRVPPPSLPPPVLQLAPRKAHEVPQSQDEELALPPPPLRPVSMATTSPVMPTLRPPPPQTAQPSQGTTHPRLALAAVSPFVSHPVDLTREGAEPAPGPDNDQPLDLSTCQKPRMPTIDQAMVPSSASTPLGGHTDADSPGSVSCSPPSISAASRVVGFFANAGCPTGTSGANGNKRSRTNISPFQLRMMREIFPLHKMPTVGECETLGKKIGLSRRVVQVWFQNQRAKEKKSAREGGGGSSGDDRASLDGISTPCLTAGFLTRDMCSLCNVRFDNGASTPADDSSMSMHLFSMEHLINLGAFLEQCGVQQHRESTSGKCLLTLQRPSESSMASFGASHSSTDASPTLWLSHSSPDK